MSDEAATTSHGPQPPQHQLHRLRAAGEAPVPYR
jgi:hypothetical protein